MSWYMYWQDIWPKYLLAELSLESHVVARIKLVFSHLLVMSMIWVKWTINLPVTTSQTRGPLYWTLPVIHIQKTQGRQISVWKSGKKWGNWGGNLCSAIEQFNGYYWEEIFSLSSDKKCCKIWVLYRQYIYFLVFKISSSIVLLTSQPLVI